jgi:hypothetical protein
MSGRIVTLELPPHQAVQEQLPQYLSGRLNAEESAKLQQHLYTCTQCQAELDWQRQLRAASPPIMDGLNMEAALAKLLPRLDAAPVTPHPAQNAQVSWWRRAAANETSWLRGALAAQFLVIAGLVLLLARPEAPHYQLLGATGQLNANLVVMFQPGLPEAELRRLLLANDARLVDGPTVTDAYLLAVPPAKRDLALRSLRAEPGIKLVEPLGSIAEGGRP